MQKRIGLSRTVRIDWLDAVASMCLENVPLTQIRQDLDHMLESVQPGAVERQRIVDTLVTIWVKSEPGLQQDGLALFQELTSRQDRIWLHYGMVLAQYPFFRACTVAIGQVARTQDTITRPLIKNRVTAELGNLGSIERAIERLFKTLEDWGILSFLEEDRKFKIHIRNIKTDRQDLEFWLLTSALRAHPSDAIPFEDLIYLPELYPFQFTVTVDQLRQDKKFEVQRQGGGLDMVSAVKIEKSG